MDIDQVLISCAGHGVAVEINRNPYRMELGVGIDAVGCPLSINPDAHSIRELGPMKWGTAIACKGGAWKRNVLYAMSVDRLDKYLRQRRIYARK